MNEQAKIIMGELDGSVTLGWVTDYQINGNWKR